jgi:hypothetical protein
MHKLINHPQPAVGLVLGTFAAVPYIHLALESWRLNYPAIPLLVSDDGSPNRDELHALCQRYGADFVSSPRRKKQSLGDISAYIHGLEWAVKCELDLVVKMSRRFIPLHNWVPGLQSLAYETQYATYSNQCAHYGYGFRTECIGFHVQSWCDLGALEEMRAFVARNETVFVENYIHNLAREVHKSNCEANREYEKRHPRPAETDAYGVWRLMADSRTVAKADILWHDCNLPHEYWEAALHYGLSYQPQAFTDPNQGFGLGLI